jgi:hypothetical protein
MSMKGRIRGMIFDICHLIVLVGLFWFGWLVTP